MHAVQETRPQSASLHHAAPRCLPPSAPKPPAAAALDPLLPRLCLRATAQPHGLVKEVLVTCVRGVGHLCEESDSCWQHHDVRSRAERAVPRGMRFTAPGSMPSQQALHAGSGDTSDRIASRHRSLAYARGASTQRLARDTLGQACDTRVQTRLRVQEDLGAELLELQCAHPMRVGADEDKGELHLVPISRHVWLTCGSTASTIRLCASSFRACTCLCMRGSSGHGR